LKIRSIHHHRLFLLPLLLVALLASSCGQTIANAKKEFADDLSASILESNDPEMIKKGVPAYLILVSSMVKGDPDNPELLESAAELYGAYASGFADSDDSRVALANRSFEYASRAMCIRRADFCDIDKRSYFEVEQLLASVEKDEAPQLFVFASSWAGRIQASSADWNAVAELPKAKAAIARVLELDETVKHGNAHLYMGVMETLLPPSMGGKPEVAKGHFERAIEISGGENQMARVLYAEKYARLLFDKELHDDLLRQVIDAPAGPEDQRLVNTLAKQKAAVLLQQSDDYF